MKASPSTLARMAAHMSGRLCAAAPLVFIAACAGPAEPTATPPERIAQSQALADRFQAELQAELSGALSTVGPVGAIGVCKETAPAIAASLSEESGARVSRIAARNRNPGNSLAPDLAQLYGELESAPMRDGQPAIAHRTTADGTTFLRAIPMRDQPCAACHGSDIAPEVQQAIDAAYPGDQATGFAAGELRGAFLIEWPANP